MWEETFKRRMREFGKHAPEIVKGDPFSIKIRAASGCFHREHSPEAYKIIDDYFSSLSEPECYFKFEEHESGPEILVYLAITTAGVTLVKSIIDLIVVILKARSEGIKKGDRKNASLELIIRKTKRNDEVVEEKIIRIDPFDLIDKQKIQKQIEKSAKSLIDEKNNK